MVDNAREWRAFTIEESNNRSRVGMPRSLSIGDYGLHTVISNDNKSTIRMSRERKYQMLRLSRWQSKIVNSRKTKNLNIAMDSLSNICSHMHISRNVKEQTALYYRKALKADLVKGRSIEAILAACLYAACRLTKNQRSLKEIAEFTSCDYKELARSYRLIYSKLGLRLRTGYLKLQMKWD
jgi:transcription initiation factor TFIIB